MSSRLTTNATVIAANLEALHIRLQHCMRQVGEARIALADARQNLAVGTILELEQLLPECDALIRTILLMHRSRDRFEQSGVQS